MKPLVSILIPAYNAEQWLAETLQSALAQTWQNKEIIVVNDGSTDCSASVARQFESCGVKVISQENKGASAARNRAFQEAKGDFIQYLDADDLLAPDKIERQVQLLGNEENYNCVTSGEWGRFCNLPTQANFVREAVWNDLLPIDWLICSWEGGGMMHPAAWLVPRAIAETAGPWDETLSLNDDGEYFCRVMLASNGIKFCSGAKSYYRSGIQGSLSGTTSKASWESAFRACELCTNYLLKKEDSPRTRHACATAFQRFIYSVYPAVPDLVKKAEAKVHFLGGSNLKPDGGPLFQFLVNTVGWKLAKQIQTGVRGRGVRSLSHQTTKAEVSFSMKVSQSLSASRYEWAEQCLRELLPLVPSHIVSDIGAGDGRMRFLTKEAGGKWQGFDLFPQSPEIHQWNLDQPAPAECQSAGIILLLDVLEHLNNPWLAVRQLADTLLPEGFLILSTPNPRWSRSRFLALSEGNLACFAQSDLDLNHHVFTPWPHIVEKLLNDNGFSIERYVTLDGSTTWPGRPYNLRYPLRCAFALLNQAIERRDPTACGMSYGIVARKAAAR